MGVSESGHSMSQVPFQLEHVDCSFFVPEAGTFWVVREAVLTAASCCVFLYRS